MSERNYENLYWEAQGHINELEGENAALKSMTREFGGYRVSELLKVIADDYRNPRAADIVKDARRTWVIDFADALLTDTLEETS